MITPRFSLDQDERQLLITIFAPYTSIKDTEIHVHEDDVRFYSKPYYLRLSLPGKVQETDSSSAEYDASESKFIIRLDKVTPGEIFPNLNLLTSFLIPQEKKKLKKPLIEVLDVQGNASGVASAQDELDEDEWYIDQTLEEEMPSEQLLHQYKYGFANNHSGLGTKYEVELGQVAQIRNPDIVSPVERRNLKQKLENEQFCDGHYLQDLMIDDDIPRLLEFKFVTSSLTQLTNKNRDQLKDLGNREFLLDKIWQKRLHFGLIDILFAYCYDWRVTEGSHCIESPWNISRISATLSWFEIFDTVKDVALSSIRRSLCFPLFRNWELTQKIFKDVLKVLKSGQTGILICLLDIHRLFLSSDPYYLQNQLYIEDYCVWAQTLQGSNISTIRSALKTVLANIEKSDVNLCLPELELAAQLVEDEEMTEEITNDVDKMCL